MRGSGKREFFIDNLLVQIHLIIEMIWWTGLAPWEFEYPFPGGVIYTLLDGSCFGFGDEGVGLLTRARSGGHILS